MEKQYHIESKIGLPKDMFNRYCDEIQDYCDPYNYPLKYRIIDCFIAEKILNSFHWRKLATPKKDFEGNMFTHFLLKQGKGYTRPPLEWHTYVPSFSTKPSEFIHHADDSAFWYATFYNTVQRRILGMVF